MSNINNSTVAELLDAVKDANTTINNVRVNVAGVRANLDMTDGVIERTGVDLDRIEQIARNIASTNDKLTQENRRLKGDLTNKKRESTRTGN
jgi:YbbR domain-containing protein